MLDNYDNNAIVSGIESLVNEKNLSDHFVLSLDGPCGSGKTTIANELRDRYGYNIVHMDDFYLPFQERDNNWMSVVAGHMDFDRLIKKVLKPYKAKIETNYISYDCHSDRYLQKIDVDLEKPLVLEGSYSSHPILKDYIDIKIYVDIDNKTQIERLTNRNRETVDKFVAMWIPFENNYFKTLKIKESSDLVYENSQ